MRTEFVDRAEDMAALDALVDELVDGRGGALVIEGLSGMGKSALLGRFRDRIEERAEPEYRVAVTSCSPGIGPGLMYGPVVELLVALEESVSRGRRVGKALRRAGRQTVASTPEILATVVPGLDHLWAVGRKITEATLSTGSMPADSLQPLRQAVAMHIVEAVLAHARAGRPVVLMIDDVQFIDPSSLQVLDTLLRRLADHPVAVVLSRATEAIGGPGGEADGSGPLVRHWIGARLLRRRDLTDLPADAVAELVRARHPEAPAELPVRISEVTGGYPVFVVHCVDQWDPADGARFRLPGTLTEMVDTRLAALDMVDRRLLDVAAAQGAFFLSRVAAEVACVDPMEAIERLSRLQERHRLIERRPTPEWARDLETDCYRFQNQALWELVRGRLSEEQQRSSHERIAGSLLGAVGDVPDAERPMQLRLEIARHLADGGRPCREKSAEAHFALARDVALHGLSFTEAEQHLQVAIEAAEALPGSNPHRDDLLARSIELLLSLTEVRWRGHGASGRGGMEIDHLAERAEAAARRHGSPELIARTALLRGKTLMATRGLEPSLAKLKEAVELAGRLEDPVPLFVATVEYGRQVSKHRLADGLEQLQLAQQMCDSVPALRDNGDPILQHARNLAQMQLGVTLFDSGRLGEAMIRLEETAQRLRGEPLNVELPIALNYLAQVYAALGRVRQACDVLGEALTFEEQRGGDSGWHAYNAALLAVLLTQDADQVGPAVDLMSRAWTETTATWLANLVPIVRNFFVEVLLAAAVSGPEALQSVRTARIGTGPRDEAGEPVGEITLPLAGPGEEVLDAADRLAVDTVLETEKTGMIRSRIAALTLRGRIALLRGQAAVADRHSRAALELYDEVGDMPALRTEEVFFYAARARAAAGLPHEADELFAKARAIVVGKSATLDDPELERSFRQDVPLNREILRVAGGLLEGE